ncbi:hypothetical protein Pmar_PMAR029327 [Perkinsus marinus ATCC 50983]|uniref:Uncharacterized protein n=1 Tax=Perkinsus marinus (strain ATCC 50983 / TXsc) TaxID=423536 RepID=C5KMU9_PERM5|nr:hypothetical protein Pmar_PMAR029327 [Perkinsus marinus ATCC 50983]EER14257.1 hypothetical protein Pmar_PMAR029327 [Perkinsus marinus ATCC 50983]|eukprot:XP_002782462.1 hypothetical protein Pmar_PMAR029327 [Perkinsus marinus ATCC 50983]
MDFQQQPYGALDDAVCGEEGRKGVIDRVNLYIGSLNWEEVPDLTNMSENDSEEALGNSKGKEAIVKVYNVKDMEKDAMKLHEVVEVVGILDGCMVKEASYREGRSGLDTITEEGNEFESNDLKQERMYRIQALGFRSASGWNPAMPLNDAMHKELVTERVRGEVIEYLAQSLHGDRLAAEYLLLHMLSRHVNVDGSTIRDGGVIVGYWPLNISGFSKSEVNEKGSEVENVISKFD